MLISPHCHHRLPKRCAKIALNNFRSLSRYDQSSLDVLVTASAGYDSQKYAGPPRFIHVYRYPTDEFQVDVCLK